MSCADNNSSLDESTDMFVVTDPLRVRSYVVHDPFDHIAATFIDPAEILSQGVPCPRYIPDHTQQEDEDSEGYSKTFATLVYDPVKESTCFVIDSSIDLLSHPDNCFFPFSDKARDLKTLERFGNGGVSVDEGERRGSVISRGWGGGGRQEEVIEEKDCLMIEGQDGAYRSEELQNEAEGLSASAVVTESLTEKRNYTLYYYFIIVFFTEERICCGNGEVSILSLVVIGKTFLIQNSSSSWWLLLFMTKRATF